MAKGEKEERACEEKAWRDIFMPHWNCTEEYFRPALTGTRAISKFGKSSFLQVCNRNYCQPWAGPKEGHAVTITFKWSIIAGSLENENTAAARLCREVPWLQRSCSHQSHQAGLAGGQLFPGEAEACLVCTGRC